MIEKIFEAIFNPINSIFIIIMIILFGLEIIKKRDFKSTIISIGVLGTFVGIFIGLLDFDTHNLKVSITHILEGLKTAFLTSIVGMGLAIILAIFEKNDNQFKSEDEKEFELLNNIKIGINKLVELNENSSNNQIIEELQRLKLIHYEIKDEIKTIYTKNENSHKELNKLLSKNFEQTNHSLMLAIEHLSKGATEEIIKALQKVIENFNQELQNQFGENFVKLNEAVINLLKWQENYKIHVEKNEELLNTTLNSILETKNSFIEIAKYQESLNEVYKKLEEIINTYKFQTEELNRHLQTYKNLSSKAETYLLNMDNVNNKFNELTQSILDNTNKQEETLTQFIENAVSQTTQQIQSSQKEYIESLNNVNNKFNELTQSILDNTNKQEQHIVKFIENSTNETINNLRKNQEELNLIINHFKQIEQQIPEALKISLEALNSGLASLTRKFKEDYEDIMNKYKNNIKK